MGSCFTCGVTWTDDHVSLDCSECGGYSMERPCPLCEGSCGTIWKRDFTMVSREWGDEVGFHSLHPCWHHYSNIKLISVSHLSVPRVWKCPLVGYLPANHRQLDRCLVYAEQQLKSPGNADEWGRRRCNHNGHMFRRWSVVGPWPVRAPGEAIGSNVINGRRQSPFGSVDI